MEQYNGIVQLCSTKLEQEQAATLRDKAAKEPNTLASFINTDGTEVIILVPVSRPDNSQPETNEEIAQFHEQAFATVSIYYESCTNGNVRYRK